MRAPPGEGGPDARAAKELTRDSAHPILSYDRLICNGPSPSQAQCHVVEFAMQTYSILEKLATDPVNVV